MTNLIDQIKETLPNECLKRSLKKETCKVNLTGGPSSFIAIDMDHKKAPVKQNETKCDYIFIGGGADVFLVPLELMKGKADATKIMKQLQAGANIAARSIIPKNKSVQFQPVAVCGKFPKPEREKLRNESSKIYFRGKQPTKIEMLECGKPLINVVDFC